MAQDKNRESKNPFESFFAAGDFTKVMQTMPAASIDMKSAMETMRKNMQAMAQAQQMTFQGIQSIASSQTRLLSQMIEDQAAVAREIMSEGTPEEKIAGQAEVMKDIYERTADNIEAFSETVRNSAREAGKLIRNRVTASMSELQESIEKSPKRKSG